jgi:outer membrane murein-binding lipoprotein Lpp
MSLHSDRATPPDTTDGPDVPEVPDGIEDDPTPAAEPAPVRGRALGPRVRAAALEAQVDRLADERDDLEREVDRLEDAVSRLEAEVRALETALDRKDAELDGIRRRYEGIVAEKEAANSRLREDSTPSGSWLGAVVSRLARAFPGR